MRRGRDEEGRERRGGMRRREGMEGEVKLAF